MEIVQYNKSAKVQDKKSVTKENCNMKKYNIKKCNMVIMQI